MWAQDIRVPRLGVQVWDGASILCTAAWRGTGNWCVTLVPAFSNTMVRLPLCPSTARNSASPYRRAVLTACRRGFARSSPSIHAAAVVEVMKKQHDLEPATLSIALMSCRSGCQPDLHTFQCKGRKGKGENFESFVFLKGKRGFALWWGFSFWISRYSRSLKSPPSSPPRSGMAFSISSGDSPFSKRPTTSSNSGGISSPNSRPILRMSRPRA